MADTGAQGRDRSARRRAASPPRSPRRATLALAGLAAGLALGGCGSAAPADLPAPAAAPKRSALLDRLAVACPDALDVARYDSDRLFAVVCGRERVVRLLDRSLHVVGSAPAGTGPARIASDGRAVLYVTDTVADTLLVYHLHPRFELIRRVHLPGAPSAIARAGDRLRVTIAGRALDFAAGSRPVPCTRSPRC
jgi:hypothetical protein